MLLFEEFSMGKMKLKNRIVRSATRDNLGSADGLPTADALKLFKRLVKGGTGLIITGDAYVNKYGQCTANQYGIHTDATVSEWRKITDKVHEFGGKIAIQLNHGGRQIKPKAVDRKPVAPSAAPNLLYFSIPLVMSEDEIQQTIQDFGSAASRAREAGFDAVQIQAAHGYLISGFLSPLTNRRRDDWGGSPERRFRFLAEVYHAVRKAVGHDFPVLCKLNLNDFTLIGLTLHRSIPIAKQLDELGIDALEISGGIVETGLNICRGDAPLSTVGRDRSLLARLYINISFGMLIPFCRFKEAYFLSYAKKLKPALNIPLILVGGNRRLEMAEQILKEGHADFIAMSRPLVREPGLPYKWQNGEINKARCLSCNQCLCEIEQGNKLKCYSKVNLK